MLGWCRFQEADPREGNVTVNLDVQSRGEPDPSFFSVPSGYFVPPVRTGSAGIGGNASK
jgi:hypothetical protein